MLEKHLFTSESVSEGHPDKVADQISDAILDAIVAQESGAHVVRETINKICHTDSENGFDCKSVSVHVSLVEQSADIEQGVNEAEKVRGKDGELINLLNLIGVGDQGMMFGFGINETAVYMPLAI